MKNVSLPFSPWVTLFALSMFLPSCPCSSFADPLATSGPVIVEPLSVPADAAGWGREYVPVAAETFSTPIRVPARGFRLQPGGQCITDSDGISWVRGSSAGQSNYLPYYGTEPGVLPLTGGREYQLTFTYRIEETPDRGFEATFYSPSAGSKNHWVPGINIEGKKGKSGTASFRARLFDESDYRAWWTVVHSGRIAIRDIKISDVSTGVVVARDDLGTAGYGPGRELACRGFTPGSEAPGSLALRCPGALRTVPSVLPLKPDTVYIVEFSWRAQQRNTEHPTILGIVSLFSERDETHVRYGKRIDGGDQDEGHYVGGIRTGSAAAPYVLQIALADKVELLISDLRFLRQQPTPRSAKENPGLTLSRAPFPRLGNYQGGLPDYIAWDASGRAKGDLPLMSTAELDRRLALYDIVVGLSGATTSLDPAACLRLRELNPDIVLLPYVISHEPSRAQWLVDQFSNPLADADSEFARGIDKGWYLRTSTGALVEDPDFPWFAKANISPDCPRDSLGRDYIDYFTEKTIDLWLRDGTWDGLFMDNLFAQCNTHIKNAFDPRAFDADYNRNGRRDETIPWTHEMTARASLRMLRQLRQRLGDAEMLIGNAGPYPELLLAPYVNGYTFEGFNYHWYENAGPSGFSEAHWGETFSNYRQMEATVRQPAAIILEATGPTPQIGAELAGGYHGVTGRDIRLQRIALGTALLGNGFYEYDLFHMLDAPSFFDEWLVGPDEASVDNATGKGWLGQALGPAVELSTDEKSVLKMPAPRRIGQDAGTVLQMDCGVNRSGASLQYVVELDWQVEATLEHPAYLNLELDGRAFDGTPINGLVAGTAGHTRAHLTVPVQHHLVVKIHVTDAGVLTVKNLNITTAHCGVFRRDFQNGVVFVNATNEPRTLSADDVRGPFRRTGPRRIAGKLDPEVNNGKPVQDSLALPAADALVLLTDSL